MKKLTRFGVAIDDDILRRFDRRTRRGRYRNRSEAIRDLMRASFLRDDWESGAADVVGVVTMVYDHHVPGLVNKLLDIQHHQPAAILCSQHVHLHHHQCLEVIVARGRARVLRDLADRLQVEKGVKFVSLSPAGGPAPMA
jgi:CopG family nickel-responsive transcriptional regulator